jgi:hypothetical protein
MKMKKRRIGRTCIGGLLNGVTAGALGGEEGVVGEAEEGGFFFDLGCV